ncbi:MAG: hypothetical protein HXX13_02385 [Bacteroidetes bacterium]|nr:hypothetical protein [Bacteroidota bacterium]
MLKNLTSRTTLIFISGLLVGASAIALLSFTGVVNTPSSTPAYGKTSVQDAQASYRRYASKTSALNDLVKGFALNKEELNAMNSLITENPSLIGFRVYMGLDNSLAPIGIVVGIDNAGKDNLNSIYKTSGSSSGPCPTLCDQTSTIIAF